MTSRGSTDPELLVDTSVAVALVVGDHSHHDVTFEAIADRRLGLRFPREPTCSTAAAPGAHEGE